MHEHLTPNFALPLTLCFSEHSADHCARWSDFCIGQGHRDEPIAQVLRVIRRHGRRGLAHARWRARYYPPID